MKKIFLIALLALFSVGCKQSPDVDETADTPAVTTPTTTGTDTTATTTTATTPTTPTTESKPYYVKNSKWENVDISKISTARAVADPSVDEALAIIATYNAENNDDQLRLYTTDVPIEEAPTVDVYIAKAVDGYYVIIVQVLGMERTYYVQNKQYFEIDAATSGGVLFVDKVPETVPVVVVPIDTRTPYEKYAIYAVITATGKIYLEEHCQDAWDSVYSKETNCMYTSVDDYFNHRLAGFIQEAQWSGWTIYSGQIYTEPTE